MAVLVVDRLARDGAGLAGAVAIPRTLPGERIEGEPVDGRIERFAILEPSGERVRPPCPHYGACGGCALQHASDAFVEGWKARRVIGALAARGIEGEVAAVHTSPPNSRRRATLSARRLKSGPVAGFHARASDTVVRIPDCRLLLPSLMAAIPAAEEAARIGGTRKGELSVTLTDSEAGIDMAVRGGRDPGPVERAGLAERFDLARLAWEEETLTRRPPLQVFGRARVAPPPGAFLQATRQGEAALVAAVRRALEGCRRIADLFAGCGTFALPLAEAAEVHAVEGSDAMTAALDAGWRRAQGLRRVSVEARDLFRRPLLPAELAGYDGAVVDPPRAGAEAQARALADGGPPNVAMVSCDSASLARDIEILLRGGYRLGRVEVVDQFRWSPHIEAVAALSR